MEENKKPGSSSTNNRDPEKTTTASSTISITTIETSSTTETTSTEIVYEPIPKGYEIINYLTSNTSTTLPNNHINFLFSDDLNYLWLGTNDGAARLKNGSWEIFTLEEGLPDRTILNIFKDKDGNYWFATLKGV